MSDINTGGPAFPIPLQPGQGWQGMAPCDGMTLRDYFAAKAMPLGFEAFEPPDDFTRKNYYDSFASDCYQIADAMLKARDA